MQPRQESPNTQRQAGSSHLHDIPPFVEAELERLYGSSFSSLPYLREAGALREDTRAWVLRGKDSSEEIGAVLLYRREGTLVRVLNRRFMLDAQALRQFADDVFRFFPGVHAVVLDQVHTAPALLHWPRTNASRPADLVLALPATPEAFLASLDQKLRYHIRRSGKKLAEDFPSFRVDFCEGTEVTESDVRELIRFNEARTLAKNEVYYRSEQDIRNIMAMVRRYGVVGIARIDGKPCAGTICHRVGDSFIGILIAHDPAYNAYRIGMLGGYLSICEAIRRGCKEFNFLSGANDYKRAFGAQPRELWQIALYRSRLHMVPAAPLALKMLGEDLYQRATLATQNRLYALDRIRNNGGLDLRSRLAFHALDLLRKGRHFLSRLAISQKRAPPTQNGAAGQALHRKHPR